jgi:hypothetical protein
MLARVSAVALLFATASAMSCTSLMSLIKGDSNNPPSGLGVPDCAYITQHASTICYGLGTWDIVNSDTCYLKASGYGCVINNGLFSTTDTFYCTLGVAMQPTETPTASASASPSASPSASASVSPSANPSPSPSASASQSASPFSTMSSSPTSLMTATSTKTSTQSASSYPTLTSTVTASVSPSMNVTIVYITDAMNDGEKAAIGLSAIFGFCILFFCCGACAFMLRRKAPEPPLSIKLPPSRRTSMVAISEPKEPKDPKEPKVLARRNSIIERTITKSAVTIRTLQ